MNVTAKDLLFLMDDVVKYADRVEEREQSLSLYFTEPDRELELVIGPTEVELSFDGETDVYRTAEFLEDHDVILAVVLEKLDGVPRFRS